MLARYGRGARYLLELKDPSDGDARRTLETVDAHGVRGAVAVQSFDHGVLRPAPAVRRGDSAAGTVRSGIPARWLRADLARAAPWATSIAPCATSVDGALVLAAHAHGLGVHVHTVNDEGEMHHLIGLGVDGLITDVPDRVRSLDALRPAA